MYVCIYVYWAICFLKAKGVPFLKKLAQSPDKPRENFEIFAQKRSRTSRPFRLALVHPSRLAKLFEVLHFEAPNVRCVLATE